MTVMSHTRRAVAALFLVSVSGSSFVAAAPLAKTAVLMPLQAVALPEELRRGVEADIRKALPSHAVQALPEGEAAELLRAIESAGVVCADKSEECVVRVGALAAVDLVVAGTLSSSPTGAVMLELVLFDVAAMQARARSTIALDVSSATARQASVGQAVVSVMKPEAWRGFLKVAVKQPGASIVVDGVPRGFSPLPQPITIVPGPHEVWVALEGFQTHRETVDVAYQKRVELKVALVPGASSPVPITVPPLSPRPASSSPSSSPSSSEAPKAGRNALRVAVYEPTIAGVPERLAKIVSSYVAAEVRKRERTSVLGGEELRSLMQSSTGKETLGECSEERCLSEVADALGVDVVVLVQITSVGDELFFGIRRIDQANQEVKGAVSERVADVDLAALLPLIGPAIERLFPDAPLRAGEKAGVDDRAVRVLRPPPLPPVVATSMFVVTGLSVAATTALFVAADGERRSYEELATRASAQAGSVLYRDVVAEYDAVQSANTLAWGLLGVSSLAFLTSGILSVFSDWEGLADIQEAPR
jgi:hypothetical protein